MIPLLSSGALASAAHWNDLFSALDDKISAAMDGKSWILSQLAPQALYPITGKPFFFVSGTRERSKLWGGSNYNHAPFVAAAGELEFEIFDEPNKVAALKDPVPANYWTEAGISQSDGTYFFDNSLEVHSASIEDLDGNPSAYFILEALTIPEKVWPYALAELIFEGVNSLTFETRWNKYHCFRIHNLNPTPLQIHFPDYDLEVPAWGIQCLRRVTVNSGYEKGFKYFQKFRSGEPRTIAWAHDNLTPYGSCGANNLVTPLVYGQRVIEYFRSGYQEAAHTPRGAKIHLDPHHLHDISSLYAGLFPALEDTTIIGDALLHRGECLEVKTDGAGTVTKRHISFNGFADLKARWPSLGINATDISGTLRLASLDAGAVAHELFGLSTNLFCSHATGEYRLRTGIDLKQPADLTNPPTPAAAVAPIVQVPQTLAFEYALLIDQENADNAPQIERFSAGSIARPYTIEDGTTPARAIVWHQDTLGTVKALDLWGNPEHPSQSTPYGEYYDREFVLTPYGLILKYKLKIPLEFLPSWFSAENGAIGNGEGVPHIFATGNEQISITDTHLVFARTVEFQNWGFPKLDLPGFALGQFVPLPDMPVFVSPRFSRYLQELTSQEVFYYADHTKKSAGTLSKHPQTQQDPIGPNGEAPIIDGVTNAAKRQQRRQEIRILSPLKLEPSQTSFTDGRVFHLDIFRDRAASTIAELLDTADSEYTQRRQALLDGRPMSDELCGIPLLLEHYNGLANRVNAIDAATPYTWTDHTLFRPNLIGPYQGLICPARQYASFTRDSAEWNACLEWGIPIRTIEDLPASYQTDKNTLRKSFSVNCDWKRETTVTNRRFFTEDPGVFERRYVENSYRITDTIGQTHIQFRDESDTIINAGTFYGANPEADTQEFFWCFVEDVQAAAEAAGFKFHLERLVTPYRLVLHQVASNVSVLHTSTPSRSLEYSEIIQINGGDPGTHTGTQNFLGEYFDPFVQGQGQANFAVMLPCIAGETPEFIADGMNTADGATARRLLLENYAAGDVLTSHVYGPGTTQPNQDFSHLIVKLAISPDENRFLRERPELFMSPETGGTNSPANVLQKVPSALYQTWTSLGRTAKAILRPISTTQHTTENFSAGSIGKALGRLAFGAQVLPLEARLT